MIERYSFPQMAELFTDETRLQTWVKVELAVVKAYCSLGMAPKKTYDNCLSRVPRIDTEFVNQVNEREKVTNHDTAAFVDVLQSYVKEPDASWIHKGLTSSDIVDTALGITLSTACNLLLEALDELIKLIKEMSLKYRDTPMLGRTHGMWAEPTTFGHKTALWALQLHRDLIRLKDAKKMVAVGKLSGAVGTYSNIDPIIEQIVCEDLGLTPAPATQVVSRDRHAQYVFALTSIGCSLEMIAVEIRHLARSEIGEVKENFAAGQKGSSAMPHKQNPVGFERLSGLSRVLRGYLDAACQNVALWHERDISHSSVERIIIPDASILAHYMIKKAYQLLRDLNVDESRMSKNLENARGLVFSQTILLALVDKGLDRDTAYRIVQAASLRAIENDTTLKDELISSDAKNLIGENELEDLFNVNKLLRNKHHVIEMLEEI
jgi:adenylosuccinate lyase